MRSDILNVNSASYKSGFACTEIVQIALDDSEAAGDNTSTWTQPANSILTNCFIVCTKAPTIVSGSIGYDVGTSAAGGEIIAAQADEILDVGTTVVIGAVTYPGMAVSLPAGDSAAQAKVGIDAGAIANGFVYDVQDDTTHVLSVTYTAEARTVHVTLTTDTAVTSTGNGSFAFVFEYLAFGALSS